MSAQRTEHLHRVCADSLQRGAECLAPAHAGGGLPAHRQVHTSEKRTQNRQGSPKCGRTPYKCGGNVSHQEGPLSMQSPAGPAHCCLHRLGRRMLLHVSLRCWQFPAQEFPAQFPAGSFLRTISNHKSAHAPVAASRHPGRHCWCHPWSLDQSPQVRPQGEAGETASVLASVAR